MRKTFVSEVQKQMRVNPKIVILLGDLGFAVWDDVRKEFPDRVLNVGAAEQAMIGISVGLALEGKIPIVYSITPFVLYRPFETIRNYIDHEKIPVKLIGTGRDRDYLDHGFCHWAQEDRIIMEKVFTNILAVWPEDKESIPQYVEMILRMKEPIYLNLRRK